VTDSRIVYRNPWMTVREDRLTRPDGTDALWGVVCKPDFALVIPVENDGFHLVEQFRHPVGRRCWEFPQGSDPGVTDLAETARIELAEETGLRAGSMRLLGTLDNAHGYSSQRFAVYLATGLTPGERSLGPDEQDMRQAFVPRAEFERMVRAGEIVDSNTVAAYALLALAG
jgi:8-oxo-dGTP pyrophosphatase MutT (NUDIX family)